MMTLEKFYTHVFKITRGYTKMASLKCHFYVIFTVKIAKVNKRDFKLYFI